MSKDVYGVFDAHEFFGEFFHNQDDYASRFSAKIKYSPETGLILEYSIVDSDVPSACEILFGILNNGKRCTLFGPFNFNLGGRRFGVINTKYGSHGFPCLVMGDFVSPDKKFDHSRFTFHHMQEFFYPQGHLDGVAYKDGTLETIKGTDWIIEIENRATFNDVTETLMNLIINENGKALKRLSSSYEKIKTAFPDNSFLLRKSLEYLFKYIPCTPKTIKEMYLDILKITSLFSIFMDRPTFPDEVKIFPNAEASNSISLLSSINLESRTVGLAKSNPSHFLMPINRNKIDLSKTISTWFELHDSYRVLSTTFQYETNHRTLHSAYSDVILFSTNIESIAHDLGMPTSDKYEGPINRYGSDELKSAIRNIFIIHNNNSLGKNLSDLRNELAHVGRPKKLIKILNISDYVDVAEILKLVVVSHLLEQIGVARDVIYGYQKRLLPKAQS
ncbi:ApeA N-terminal domain 1-containing protein [Cellvibrio fibrivorans]|uniref:ApeA N-terminal domain-containing protein n=1 Tax=Cellvibrio fibrivorans TaxID=126350 RepID=A0ABU1UTU4_9GAMM|nr:HEPN domain-containing protein [Cellvibrio fibrivorans]MDR7088605.1 hypothetical protein [Cellvibrio fibrivorans]